jgi:hypothetical protein
MNFRGGVENGSGMGMHWLDLCAVPVGTDCVPGFQIPPLRGSIVVASGLKPSFCVIVGTAEAVPFSSLLTQAKHPRPRLDRRVRGRDPQAGR